MRLDDDLVRIAQEFIGVAEETAVIREALKALSSGRAPADCVSLEGNRVEIEKYSSSQAGDALILADTSIWIDHLSLGIKVNCGVLLIRRSRCDPSFHHCGT